MEGLGVVSSVLIKGSIFLNYFHYKSSHIRQLLSFFLKVHFYFMCIL